MNIVATSGSSAVAVGRPLRARVARAVSVWLAALCALAIWIPTPARACSCRRPPLRVALSRADVVAEVRLLEVVQTSPDPIEIGGVQLLRVRIERVFRGPPTLDDGEELWVEHHMCSSAPIGRARVGSRWIQVFGSEDGRLVAGYCSVTLSAYEPVPGVLLEERARWRRSRR